MTFLTHEFVSYKPDSSFSSWSHNEPENNKTRPTNIEKTRETDKSNNEKPNTWDFTQALVNNSYGSETDSTKVYVHPLDKSSTFWLSSKSLEMCTEGLGCETGNNFYSGLDEFSDLVSKTRNKPAKKKISKKIDFPPPLTSISGEMQSCRENGRLVIKASAFSSTGSCFKAERENGRLRLCLVKRNDEIENMDDEVEKDCDEIEKGGDQNGRLLGGEWSRSRCNGDESGNKRMPSLPFCVAIS
ncbi:hypothetical protein CASFOL_005245 [Castilleja foliolosa]|uniref:FAF domain-containing protein n=1 Tax=Castilleja foliolosa TaxID=1961234 RepID=A0ABD3E460_9LAMI